MKSELDVYRDCVEQLMMARSSKKISNGLPQHAAVLFEAFFRNAKSSVKIFCKNLDSEVFENPDVIGAAIDALKRDVSIDVIVQERPLAKSFLASASVFPKFDIIEDAVAKISAIRDINHNFAVMDSCAYRFEPDSSKVNAIASMFAPDAGEGLTRGFNLMMTAIKSAPIHANTEASLA